MRALLDLLYPPRCAACEAEAWSDGSLCGTCAAHLPPVAERCRRCGRRVGPHAEVDECARCAAEDLPLDGVVAAWPYEGVPRALVLALKYGACPAAARILGDALAAALRARLVPGDLLVPVPLSGRRRRVRGYNQADLLARVVERRLGVARDPRALVRRVDAPPQVGLPRALRRRGPRGAFRGRRSRLAGRCVLLVDDVLTSGGTARACAATLRRRGALSVVAAVACRAESR